MVDYHLAQHDEESAWSLYERTDIIRKGRVYSLDSGRYGRLLRHYTWVRFGYDRMRELSLNSKSTIAGWQRGHRLDIELFESWVAEREGDEQRVSSGTLAEILEYNYYGVLAFAVALGVRPHRVPAPRPGESPAQLVARLFPSAHRIEVPTSVFLSSIPGFVGDA
jgi:hypothetical protein